MLVSNFIYQCLILDLLFVLLFITWIPEFSRQFSYEAAGKHEQSERVPKTAYQN